MIAATYGVPKLGARTEKSTICRQDANFGTPTPQTDLAAHLTRTGKPLSSA